MKKLGRSPLAAMVHAGESLLPEALKPKEPKWYDPTRPLKPDDAKSRSMILYGTI